MTPCRCTGQAPSRCTGQDRAGVPSAAAGSPPGAGTAQRGEGGASPPRPHPADSEGRRREAVVACLARENRRRITLLEHRRVRALSPEERAELVALEQLVDGLLDRVWPLPCVPPATGEEGG